jgi:Fic family protein
LSVSAELAQDISRTESAIRRLNDDPPRTRLLEAVRQQLLRAEAVASSRIEGYELSHRRLAEAVFAPDRTDANARTVYANVRAMEEAVRRATGRRPLSIDDIRAIHRRLFEGGRDAHLGGVLRESQNWIGGSDYSAYGADFIPVPESDVRPLLEDLCAFAERDDLPALVQAAVVHAQFETVHPFVDGNGRVGRCLIHVVLRRRSLAPHYVPPISVALGANTDEYVAGLTAYRAEQTEEWLTIFVRATDASVRAAEELARAIEQLQERWRAKAGQPRAGSAHAKLIDALPVQPVVDVVSAARAIGSSEEGARRAIARLADAGVLQEVTGRMRGRTWECVGLFALLDEFDRALATARSGLARGQRAPRRTRKPSAAV